MAITNSNNQEQPPSSNSDGNIQSPREGQVPSPPSTWTPEDMQEAEPYPMPDVSNKDKEKEKGTSEEEQDRAK